MEIRPLSDKIVVRRLASQTKTKLGIIIPDAVAEKADRGTVVAIGNGKRDLHGILNAVDVSVNDMVLFGKHAGQIVKINGEELVILTEDQILAVINEGAKVE